MRDAPSDIPRSRPAGLAGADIAVRVVLVGRTGLDAQLRLDPAVELIRARSGFDTVGELANPVMPVPDRTVVIVGEEAILDEDAGGAPAFAAAVQRVAPGSLVFACLEPGVNSRHPEAYDTIVPREIPTAELRAIIHGDEPAPEPTEIELAADDADEPMSSGAGSSHAGASNDRAAQAAVDPVPSRVPSPVPADRPPIQLAPAELEALRSGATLPSDTPGQAADEPADLAAVPPAPVDRAEIKPIARPQASEADSVLVAALMSGRDVLEPAMDLVRARTGRPGVVFVAASEQEPRGGRVAVEWNGRRFGWLVPGEAAGGDDDADPGWLASQAQWLGSWLALARLHRDLRLEALTDPVSGAWNRRYFDRFLATAIPHARSHRYKLTVLVFDLDNFKSFNDRFGHEAGDVILRETVALMRSMTRPTDRICRIGGDEFAVIFYEPDGPRDKHSDHPDDFEVVAARFQRAVVEQRFPKLGIELPGQLTISGGLATFPWDGQTAEELLRRADLLAIESKRQGKNTITFGSGAPTPPGPVS